jgi:hypothetical protein
MFALIRAYLGEEIMSAISEFAAKQNAFNTRLDAALAGIGSDIKTLNDKIAELQGSPGEVTPEDQALLDSLQTSAEALAAKFEAVDAMTPPKA